MHKKSPTKCTNPTTKSAAYKTPAILTNIIITLDIAKGKTIVECLITKLPAEQVLVVVDDPELVPKKPDIVIVPAELLAYRPIPVVPKSLLQFVILIAELAEEELYVIPVAFVQLK